MVVEEGASGPKGMGRVKKAAMSSPAGRADGKLVSELVKPRLSAK